MLDKDANLKMQREEPTQSLRACEARFRNMITRSADGVVIVDGSGCIRFINPAAAAIFGRNTEEQQGKPFGFPVVAGKTTELHIGQRGKQRIVVEMRVVETEWYGNRAYLATLRDITKRRRNEQELRKIHRAVLASPDIVMITDASGAIEFVNHKFTAVTGYSLAEAVGQNPRFLKSGKVPPEVYKELWETILAGREWRGEMINRKKDGELYWESASIAPVTETEGKIINFIAVTEDITERKRKEAEIEKLNKNLAARALELESANRELEAFSYTVSHDLRRPLTNINGYCQVILELFGSILNEQCKGYVQEIHEGTLQMNRLIGALLKFSCLTRSKLHREMVDLSSIVKGVAAELQLAEPERGVTIQITKGITVNGDANLLRLVMENLLGNAWKYTGTREEAVIEFGVTEIAEKPACFVRDNGTGFNMADADKLFVPFQRLSGADQFAGHGIGLATVDRIIRRHGGRVWAEGELGKGATFYFTLPADGSRDALQCVSTPSGEKTCEY